jgi:hypothetical protein
VGKPGLQAGGGSAGFAEGRDKMLTDFGGFELGPQPVPATCQEYAAIICDDVQPNIIFMMQFPVAEIVCDVATQFEMPPTGIVAINLSDRPKISGFVFVAGLLSNPLRNELNAILGLSANGFYTHCDDLAAQQ